MASHEDRIGKFLRRLLLRRSALEIVQSLARDQRPLPPRIPGGSSVAAADVDGRWNLLDIDASSRRALLNREQGEDLALYPQNIENCIGTVKVPVGLAGPLRVRGMFASGDYYIPLA